MNKLRKVSISKVLLFTQSSGKARERQTSHGDYMALSQAHYSLLSDKKEHEKKRNFQEAEETKSSQCSKHSLKQAAVRFTPRPSEGQGRKGNTGQVGRKARTKTYFFLKFIKSL